MAWYRREPSLCNPVVRLACLVALSALVGCGLLGQSHKDKPDMEPAGQGGDEIVPLAAAATPTVAPGPAVPASVDTLDLDRDEVAMLLSVFAKIPDPCAATASMLQALRGGGCELADQLSVFAVRGIQKGYGKAQMTGMLVREVKRLTAVVEVDTTGAPAVGPADAKVKIVVFSDFECPYCRKVVEPTRKLQQHYSLWIAFKHFPLRNHAFAEPAARATWAAHQQGKFWQMHDKLFEHNDKLDDDSLKKYAAELGLKARRFATDLVSDAARKAVARDREHGIAAGVDGTPTFFVNGRQAHSPAQVQSAIRKAMKDAGAASIPARLSF